MLENVVDANRDRNLFLRDGDVVYFAPKGWCDGWLVADGESGGLDYVNDQGVAEPEINCYAPTGDGSEYDTAFVAVADLQKMEEITEAKARELSPALFEHLRAIDGDRLL